LTLRAAVEQARSDIEIVAINDLGSPEVNAHLLKHDTVHGVFPFDVAVSGLSLMVNGHRIQMLRESKLDALPWKALGVDLVMECTGVFTNREMAAGHLAAGAKRVLVSAPSKGADKTIVYGVNDEVLSAEDCIVSNASCTTNCLAPVAKVLHEAVGIERGFMTTIHSYTGDQRTVDTVHKDFYRARAAAANLIPTATGAARAVGLVLPELAGKLTGAAIRVPAPNVSLADLTFDSALETNAEAVNHAMAEAVRLNRLNGVLEINSAPLVSSDFNHSSASSIFDISGTQVIDGRFVRIMAWYDNEWGFSNRMLDTAAAMGALL